ncbi:uncharacterized protein B0H18DRAFT_1122800 [Fomitopsis serialis]|uniref:uncharacterized protein n=1 Tax=Fomitopsis serialis TaxID=139415 RepID=UPI0020079030|nr:uncharacterized protein B0H18DRAFT_1122800 [Neoantrodia serialis]KAH9918994.1 hypothetical protein B0H18DRAFT_1122800 [Neoantrodia serialis]
MTMTTPRAVPHEVQSDGEDDDDEPHVHASDAEALEPLTDDSLENEDTTDEDDAELDGAVSGSSLRAASHKGAPSPELTENPDDEEAGEDPVEDDAPVAEF